MVPIADVFADAGCRGWLCVRDIDGPGIEELDADEVVPAASVYKIAVALELFRQVHDGRVDLRERVVLAPASATPGPTGFSGFEEPVEASMGDLAWMMMTISDNAATDAVTERVGLESVHQTLLGLGLGQTVIPALLRDGYAAMAREAGFSSWTELARARDQSPDGAARIADKLADATTGGPIHAIRTTAAEMAELLCLIWTDQAGPPEACARVRRLMSSQLTRHRLAMGFSRDVAIAAKSGSLFGVIRNEAGVIEYPDGHRYAAAVFTRARRPWINDNQINTAIGLSAARAVANLRCT